MIKSAIYLSSKDAAHILNCSPDDVIDLAQQRKLRATKEGRFWKFRNTDVVAYKLISDMEDKTKDYYICDI